MCKRFHPLDRRIHHDLTATEIADTAHEERALELLLEMPPVGRDEDVRAVYGDAERGTDPARRRAWRRLRARARKMVVQMGEPEFAHACRDQAGLEEVRHLQCESPQPWRPGGPGKPEGAYVSPGRACPAEPGVRPRASTVTPGGDHRSELHSASSTCCGFTASWNRGRAPDRKRVDVAG